MAYDIIIKDTKAFSVIIWKKKKKKKKKKNQYIVYIINIMW